MTKAQEWARLELILIVSDILALRLMSTAIYAVQYNSTGPLPSELAIGIIITGANITLGKVRIRVAHHHIVIDTIGRGFDVELLEGDLYSLSLSHCDVPLTIGAVWIGLREILGFYRSCWSGKHASAS